MDKIQENVMSTGLAKAGEIDKTSVVASQLDACRFLLDPATTSIIPSGNEYTNDSGNVEVIHTHCAHLFLHKNIVYKIKRAVAYSYLDMTSITSRERLCKRELQLNQPVLPDIYLDVVPITVKADGSLTFDGDGEVLEWVLHMARFDEHQVLDTLANDGMLGTELAQQLGVALAVYHSELASASVNDGYQRIAEVVHELILEFSALASPLPGSQVSRFAELSLLALENFKDLLNQRATDGFVKRCHGDLHLRNVLVRDGIPIPFDALEFDERMATTDVLYDLSFMIMDLAHRGLREHENIVLNEYLLHSPAANTDALPLLPLFLACRAGIRAMTTAQAAQADTEHAVERRKEAEKYLRSANNYLNKTPTTLVAIGGLSGTGKSTMAAGLPTHLAPSPGAILLRSDAERKASYGIPEYESLPAESYTDDSARENYQRLANKTSAALGAGYSVIVDATFLKVTEQEHFEQLAKKTGSHFTGLWLTAPIKILRARVAQREGDASDATLDVLEAQVIAGASAPGWHRVDVSDDAIESFQRCLKIIADERHHTSC